MCFYSFALCNFFIHKKIQKRMKEGGKSAHQYQAKPNTNARFANSQPQWGEGKNGNECQRNCTKQKSKNAYETTRKQIKTKRIPKTITMYTCICANAHKMNEHRMITPKKSNNLGHMQNIACLSNASWESGKPTRMRAVTRPQQTHCPGVTWSL